MKKIAVLALVALCLVGIVSAATTVSHTWSGTGTVTSDVVAGDDHESSLYASGSAIEGAFDLTDNDDNPYNYGVDTVSSYATSRVAGGISTYQIDRTDAKTSYGPAGQVFYVETAAFDGASNVEFAVGARSNYASMVSSTYGKAKTTSGKNFEASGNYGIYHTIQDGDGDGASIEALGTGTLLMDSMSSEMGGNSFKFGKGAGCFTNADTEATGVGSLHVSAWADNAVAVTSGGLSIPGDGTDNSATYDLHVNYAGHFVYADHSLEGS